MKLNIGNDQQQNQLPFLPLLLLLISGIYLFLNINSNHTLVYANTHTDQSRVELNSLMYGIDIREERISAKGKLLTIKRGNNIFHIFTTSSDLHEIFREYGITLASNDFVFLSTDALVNGTIVSIVRTKILLVENTLDIPFETETIESAKRPQGEKVVVQKGVLGIKTERELHYYEDGELVGKELIEEYVSRDPVKEIVEVGTFPYTLDGIEIRGYDCPYWYTVVDSGPYSEEEKKWLKFIMYCESKCNAESNKSGYKGLFQWSPYWWSKQFTENIFDGHAQLLHTVEKYRAGESTRAKQWPHCNAKYLASET